MAINYGKEYKMIDALRRIYVRKYWPLIRKALNDMLTPVLDAIINTSPEIALHDIDNLMESEQLSGVYKKMFTEVAIRFAKRNLTAKHNLQAYSKKNTEPELIESIWIDEISKYYDLNTSVNISQVLFTQKALTKELLRGIIDLAQSEGLGVEAISARIRKELAEEYGKQAKWRARRIAQTEVLTASNYATEMSAESLGYEYVKTWVCGGKSKTERHRIMPGLHGQKKKKGELFDVDGEQMSHPGDGTHGASAGNIVNCKCIHVIKIAV